MIKCEHYAQVIQFWSIEKNQSIKLENTTFLIMQKRIH